MWLVIEPRAIDTSMLVPSSTFLFGLGALVIILRCKRTR
ncbi:MAG: PEP-CTERM sorting domain-containing protein [Akkermansiaceae bacterium]|nr:PEP-CTERM sorting domain-containing protein [Akkermansiaceae bacterium]